MLSASPRKWCVLQCKLAYFQEETPFSATRLHQETRAIHQMHRKLFQSDISKKSGGKSFAKCLRWLRCYDTSLEKIIIYVSLMLCQDFWNFLNVWRHHIQGDLEPSKPVHHTFTFELGYSPVRCSEQRRARGAMPCTVYRDSRIVVQKRC